MIIANPENYKFVKFVRSHLKQKKYDAILMNKKTGRLRKVPFGQKGYQHFKDTTGLGLYSRYDHLDKERRRRYRLRHEGEQYRKYSSGYFSYKYLW